MNAAMIAAFTEELEKSAQVPGILQKLWRSGLGRAAAGAVPGAAIGAAADKENRVRGAIFGGAGGAAGGYAARLATKGGRTAAKDWLKRYKQTQIHSLTGRGQMPRKPGMKAEDLAQLEAAEKAGLTSVPGLVKGLRHNPKATIREAWDQAGKTGKVMAVGDIGFTAHGLSDPDAKAGAGEQLAGGLGRAGGYLVAGRMPLIASSIVGGGLGYLTGKLGKGIDVARGYKPPKKPSKEALTVSTRPTAQGLWEAVPDEQRQSIQKNVSGIKERLVKKIQEK
jgi:hypothetical protein